MCLGGGGKQQPKLQQRTLPAEGTRPADESASSNRAKKAGPDSGVREVHPSATATAAQREWEETGNVTETKFIKRNDPGINL